MTDLPEPELTAASLETQLARAYRAPGDPGARLVAALMALEGAAWALPLEHEGALYRLLARLLGAGTVRVDPRLPVDQAAMQALGLEPGGLEPDWRGAQAVWLIEPDERAFTRARRAGVPLIVDATLSPGGSWPSQGAQFVTYLQGGALTGHADPALAALLGAGEAPSAEAGGLSPLAAALALRDLAALPARLGRQGRAAARISEVLGERVEAVAGSTLLVQDAPDVDQRAPLGGVVSAARHVTAGWLLSVGLERTEELLAQLDGAAPAVTVDATAPEVDFAEAPSPENTPEPLPSPAVDEPLSPDLPSAEAGDPAEGLNDQQHAAYMRLREWRNAEAKRQEVSRFIVASNATLAEVARRAPQSLEELRGIKGLGPQRLARYGEKLVELGRG